MPDYQLEQDDLAVADRLRLFGFVRRDDQMLYLWVLRAMNELRLEHVTQAHTDVVAAALADLSQRHPDAPAEVENLRQRLDNLADDGVLHRLRSARHFGSPHDDEELISPRKSWWDAPGVEVSVTLFAKGKAPTPGVPRPVADKRASTRHLREEQAAARASERESATRLAELGPHDRVLNDTELQVLLKLLTRALESRTIVAGRVTASGGNDALTMRLVPSATGSAVRTRDGVLRLPGFALELQANA